MGALRYAACCAVLGNSEVIKRCCVSTVSLLKAGRRAVDKDEID